MNDLYQQFVNPNYGLENKASVDLDVLRDCLYVLAQRRHFCDVLNFVFINHYLL